ncbi:hypothetical protein L596_027553 [Steinernema carpocapsae]|uniref:SXP/RAL-2 family protein Ani s 5-like cation-binding domain-containing protein n=1 Tax=Steinernema carpocapsae TaxID=34508 RepID=A0A4U5LVX0_STECR|nr:hypothetical protein L596_027553 [Steinernema carpocapsae]
MSIAPLLLWTLFVLTTAKPSWDFASSRSDQPPYPAWYQVPKSPLNYSPEAGYDRPATNYDRSSGYGRPSQTVYGAYGAARGMKNPPMEFGNERAIANNVLPGGRKPIAPFYGGAMGTPQMANMAQDIEAEFDRPSAVLKYHPLLARRPSKPTSTEASARTLAKPFWTKKSPYNVVTMVTKPPSVQPRRPSSSKVTLAYSTPPPWIPIRLRGKTLKTSTTSTTSTTQAPSTTSELRPKQKSLINYLLRIWPNAELFAAIKDVVSKFRASLDQSNVEQDVKKMGTQLENTWQELRRGSNGRLDHIFERAQQMLQDPSASRQ